MSKAAAFIAGFGTSYMSGMRQKKEDARQEARDKRDTDMYEENKADRAEARSERDRARADREAIRSAGAPVDVQTTPGQAMPAEAGNSAGVASGNPTTVGYKVGANTFAQRGAADMDAAAQNTPEATRSRVTAAMMAQGNVLGADQLNTSGMQQKAAGMAIKKGEREEANAVFDQGIKTALQTGGPPALAKFMSESQADGQGGKVQFQAVTAPDGKSWQMHRVGDGGATQPFGQVFPSDEGGMASAGMMLSRTVPDSEKVKHLMAVKESDRKIKHDDGTLAVSQQNADSTAQNARTNEQYRKDQVRMQERQMAMTAAHQKAVLAGKAQPGGPAQISLKDMRDFEGDLDKYIKDQFPVKDGADASERAGMNAQATSKKALGSALFQSNAAIGIPLTAGTVLQAMELAADRKNVRVVQVGGAAHEAVVVNGQAVITTGPLQKKAPPPVAAAPPVAAPQNAAAQAAAGVQQPAPQAAAQPAPPPTVMQGIEAEAKGVVAARHQEVLAAQAQLAAVAKSGDPQALQRYAQIMQAAIKARDQAAQRLGNAAPAFIATLPQQ